jgi:hypothetical protein
LEHVPSLVRTHRHIERVRINLRFCSAVVEVVALQDFAQVYDRFGSKPEFTALQQQRPVHLKERTCRGKL